MANWDRYKELRDFLWLNGKLDGGAKISEIASEIGCGRQSVVTAMKVHGLKKKPFVRMNDEMKKRLGM